MDSKTQPNAVPGTPINASTQRRLFILVGRMQRIKKICDSNREGGLDPMTFIDSTTSCSCLNRHSGAIKDHDAFILSNAKVFV
jgi:hypothetical protein